MESAERNMEAKITDTTAMVVMVIAPPTSSGSPKKRARTTSIAPAVVEIQARGRHRGDGSRPVGNSSRRKPVSPKKSGIAGQPPSHAATSSPGSGPWSVVTLISP